VITGAAASALALAASPAAAAASRSPHPSELTLVELLPLLRSRALSARELLDDCVRMTDSLEPAIQAYLMRTTEQARAAAEAADEARARGDDVGPLAGVPVGLKDLYYTAGTRTTAGSRVLADFVPDTDATVCSGCATRAAVSPASSTRTSSPTAPRRRRPATRGTPAATPAGRAAGRGRPSPPACCRSRRARTPAGRCASPPQ
jgi:hypothetical protein